MALPNPQDKDNLSFAWLINILYLYGQHPAADFSSFPRLGLPESLSKHTGLLKWIVQVLSYTKIEEKCVHREAHRKLQKGSRGQRRRAQDLEPDCQLYLLLAKWLWANYFSGPQLSHLKKRGN